MYSRLICNFVLFFPSLLKCVYLHNLKKFKGNKKINMGKKVEKGCMYMCLTESLHCTPETSNIVNQLCPNIK